MVCSCTPLGVGIHVLGDLTCRQVTGSALIALCADQKQYVEVPGKFSTAAAQPAFGTVVKR
eukprot:433102-Amphidinium_carterae.1